MCRERWQPENSAIAAAVNNDGRAAALTGAQRQAAYLRRQRQAGLSTTTLTGRADVLADARMLVEATRQAPHLKIWPVLVDSVSGKLVSAKSVLRQGVARDA